MSCLSGVEILARSIDGYRPFLFSNGRLGACLSFAAKIRIEAADVAVGGAVELEVLTSGLVLDPSFEACRKQNWESKDDLYDAGHG
jgi:hypothetical protein